MIPRPVRITIFLLALSYWLWVLGTHGIEPFGTVLLPLFFTVLIVYPVAMRSALMKQMVSPFETKNVGAEDWPAGAQAGLEEFTPALEGLGFRQGRDEIWRLVNKQSATSYLRFMVHPDHHCIGIVNFTVLKNGKVLPPYITMVSCLGTAANTDPLPAISPIASPEVDNSSAPLHGLTYTTHNRQHIFVNNMMLHPQVLSSRMVGATTEELLKRHLERRTEILEVTGLPLEQEDLPTQYRSFFRRYWLDTHRILARKNPWGLLLAALIRGKNKPEWEGMAKRG